MADLPSPLRVLHVEDDPFDRELVAETLRAAGLACDIVAVDSRAAFEKALATNRVDVILSDDQLPAFDGLTAQAIAANRAPDVPFIVVSGTVGEEIAIERLKAGATDYVLKQRLARLPSSIDRAIREAQRRVEHARAEAEIHRLASELEQRVVERTAELGAAQLEAERANRAKSDFLSRMSHDLRTPLNAILGFAQLMATEKLAEGQPECVDQILRGGKYLLDLINEVLDIARIEAGRLTLSPEPVNVGEIVGHAVDLVAPLARARGISLVVADVPERRQFVLADRQRLSQILLNLLSNAVKYNRANGRVTTTFEAPSPGRFRIKVSDTGAGIPAEKLQMLFTPFERLGAEATSTEGTGLGLALSRGLAEAMGGSIDVVSEIDRGSTFWVELAATDDAVRSETSETKMPTLELVPAAGGVVLYVEDNLSNVRLMERLLVRRPSVTLFHASTGAAGVAMAREHKPDMVFLDLHLPDASGEEVLRQLWDDTALRSIPVVVLTADATFGQISRLLASGAAAYLTKPLELAKVLDVLDRILAVSPDHTAHVHTPVGGAVRPGAGS